MTTIRNRAREHLPMVLLTLLSIVQALALELLWAQVRESARLAPATRRDFYPVYGIIAALILAGIYLTVSGDRGLFALVAVITAIAFLLRQFVVTARFWDMSVSD